MTTNQTNPVPARNDHKQKHAGNQGGKPASNRRAQITKADAGLLREVELVHGRRSPAELRSLARGLESQARGYRRAAKIVSRHPEAYQMAAANRNQGERIGR